MPPPADLADTYRALARRSPVAALAGLAAYESQAAAIAASKGDGLRRWYGVDAAGTRFWDVHAAMDADHGDWAVDALALLGADAAEVARGRPTGRRRLVGAARRARGRGSGAPPEGLRAGAVPPPAQPSSVPTTDTKDTISPG